MTEIDISGTRRGTYVREPDGAQLLYFSPVRWNAPVHGLQWWLDGKTTSSLSAWEIVRGAEALAVHRAYRLAPGEYVEED